MDMKTTNTPAGSIFGSIPTTADFAGKVNQAITRSNQTGRPFFILIFKMSNFESFKKRRSPVVVNNLFREISIALRKAVHPSQFVGRFQDGWGVLFDAVDVGHADTVSKKLILLFQNVIRTGKYNDLSGRWTDILHQFLHPNNPGLIHPTAGWAVYPRDGNTVQALVNRAVYHMKELNR